MKIFDDKEKLAQAQQIIGMDKRSDMAAKALWRAYINEKALALAIVLGLVAIGISLVPDRNQQVIDERTQDAVNFRKYLDSLPEEVINTSTVKQLRKDYEEQTKKTGN